MYHHGHVDTIADIVDDAAADAAAAMDVAAVCCGKGGSE